MRTHVALSLTALVLLPLSTTAQVTAHSATGGAGSAKPSVVSAPPPALPLTLVRQLPGCTADQLLVSTNGEDGNFNGMSHSGTLIILRNNGTQVCRILPMAQASLLDKAGKTLGPFSTRVPGAAGMHPGPVVLPIALAVNAELTATLYWVSGPVFGDNLCLQPATLVLRLGDVTVKTPLEGQLCGERAKGVSAELSRFAPDQIPTAANAKH